MNKVLFGAVLFSATQMFGAITPTLTSVTSNGSGGYTWTYNVQLAADQDAKTGTVPGTQPLRVSTSSQLRPIISQSTTFPDSSLVPTFNRGVGPSKA